MRETNFHADGAQGSYKCVWMDSGTSFLQRENIVGCNEVVIHKCVWKYMIDYLCTQEQRKAS